MGDEMGEEGTPAGSDADSRVTAVPREAAADLPTDVQEHNPRLLRSRKLNPWKTKPREGGAAESGRERAYLRKCRDSIYTRSPGWLTARPPRPGGRRCLYSEDQRSALQQGRGGCTRDT